MSSLTNAMLIIPTLKFSCPLESHKSKRIKTFYTQRSQAINILLYARWVLTGVWWIGPVFEYIAFWCHKDEVIRKILEFSLLSLTHEYFLILNIQQETLKTGMVQWVLKQVKPDIKPCDPSSLRIYDLSRTSAALEESCWRIESFGHWDFCSAYFPVWKSGSVFYFKCLICAS